MLVGRRSANHPQQVARHGADDSTDDRATTAEVFGPLHETHHFTVDVAAATHNAKLPRFYDRRADGLAQSWAGERVWCNPPYSAITPWVEKAWASIDVVELVAMLLPANRTEQGWWQDLVEPFRDRGGSPLTTRFLRGRIRFIAAGRQRVEANERPPFGCVLLLWEPARRAPDFIPPVLQPRLFDGGNEA